MQTIYNDMPRPPAHLVEGFRAVLEEYSPSCLVTDARLRVGAIGGLLPVRPEHKIVGPALTVNLSVDDLVDCMPVLARSQPGDVIVLACHGATQTAMWGGLMSTLSLKAGIAAGIVDGAIRDVDEMTNAGFKAIARRMCVGHAFSTPVRWGESVEVFGRRIDPGQLIHADKHGFLAIPKEDEAHLLDAARFMDNNE
ncbi:MAG TPA: RraA family protein, partial [Amycolatopsis sp.]|nr:RraA family protein [Amycolatopsis sp.]